MYRGLADHACGFVYLSMQLLPAYRSGRVCGPVSKDCARQEA